MESNLKKESYVLEAICRAFPSFNVVDLRVLLAISINDGVVMKDLVNTMEIPQPTISRSVKKLSGNVICFDFSMGNISFNFEFKGGDGEILVEQCIHPIENKKRTLHLTPLGIKTLNLIMEKCNES